MANELRYGDRIHLLNLCQGDGGYLDVNGGAGTAGGQYGVSTATVANRDGAGGTWKIVSGSCAAAGTTVRSGDIVYLRNLYGGNGGYLDVSAGASSGQQQSGGTYDVTTAYGKGRDGNSSRWQSSTPHPLPATAWSASTTPSSCGTPTPTAAASWRPTAAAAPPAPAPAPTPTPTAPAPTSPSGRSCPPPDLCAARTVRSGSGDLSGRGLGRVVCLLPLSGGVVRCGCRPRRRSRLYAFDVGQRGLVVHPRQDPVRVPSPHRCRPGVGDHGNHTGDERACALQEATSLRRTRTVPLGSRAALLEPHTPVRWSRWSRRLLGLW